MNKKIHLADVKKFVRLASVIIGVVALIVGFGPYACILACDMFSEYISEAGKTIATIVFIIVNFVAMFFVKNDGPMVFLKLICAAASLVVLFFADYTKITMQALTVSPISKIVAIAIGVFAIVIAVVSYIMDNKAPKRNG